MTQKTSQWCCSNVPERCIRARGLGCRLLSLLLLWQQRAHQRHLLADLSDQRLRDMGISRAQAMREARKPCWRR